jgi:hypothetical protein
MARSGRVSAAWRALRFKRTVSTYRLRSAARRCTRGGARCAGCLQRSTARKRAFGLFPLLAYGTFSTGCSAGKKDPHGWQYAPGHRVLFSFDYQYARFAALRMAYARAFLSSGWGQRLPHNFLNHDPLPIRIMRTTKHSLRYLFCAFSVTITTVLSAASSSLRFWAARWRVWESFIWRGG